MPDNCLVIRADADDLWRQLALRKIKLERHYLLFPNPYPKAAQLNQRWHGAPIFPELLKLGGLLEVRTNWRIYLDEFAMALRIAGGIDATIESYKPIEAISAFELKYDQDDQTLWRLTAELG